MIASYICAPAGNTDPEPTVVSAGQMWRAAHVRESQYFLQIIRCNDLECCSAWRSSLQHLLPDRFLPNPVLMQHLHSGQNVITDVESPIFLPLFINLQLNRVLQENKMGNFIIPPYDLNCPSLEPFLSKRCCSVCGIYHASIKSAMLHNMKECHPRTAPPIPDRLTRRGRKTSSEISRKAPARDDDDSP